MTWLESHVRDFVIPGIRTLARANGKTLYDHQIKPWDGIVRPSSKCKIKEAGMIHAVASSVLPKGQAARDVVLGLCQQLGTRETAEFVYELDPQGRVKKLGNHYPGVNGADVLHSFLCASTRAIKAHTRHPNARVIYPGRDVWAFEVMSQRMGVKSIYDSRVSREIDRKEAAFKEVVNSWPIPNWGYALAFDSGYAGTVPRAIGRVAGHKQINIVMLSAVDEQFQVFPGHTGSRAKALALEYLAKYRKRCTVQNDELHQPLADLEEFIKAALLTCWIWHHVSPRRLPSWQKEHVRKQKKRRGPNISIGNGSGITWSPANLTASSFMVNNPSMVQTTATAVTSPIHIFAGNTGTTTVIDPWATTFGSANTTVTGTSSTGGLW
jgi:hypothetical protein